jgi:hypothetical protein
MPSRSTTFSTYGGFNGSDIFFSHKFFAQNPDRFYRTRKFLARVRM